MLTPFEGIVIKQNVDIFANIFFYLHRCGLTVGTFEPAPEGANAWKQCYYQMETYNGKFFNPVILSKLCSLQDRGYRPSNGSIIASDR